MRNTGEEALFHLDLSASARLDGIALGSTRPSRMNGSEDGSAFLAEIFFHIFPSSGLQGHVIVMGSEVVVPPRNILSNHFPVDRQICEMKKIPS